MNKKERLKLILELIIIIACIFNILYYSMTIAGSVTTEASSSDNKYKRITNMTPESDDRSMFSIVEQTKYFKVLYQRDTNVMYVMTKDGDFELLVNADGSPMLWDTLKEEVKKKEEINGTNE